MKSLNKRNFRLLELKSLDFNALRDKYQKDTNNPIDRLRKLEKEYNEDKKKNYLIYKKINYLKKFHNLLKELSDYYEAFFHHYNEKKKSFEDPSSTVNLNEVETAKIFTESCGIHITRINTSYIQRSSHDITIKLGISSIIIGVFATLISLCFSFHSNTQSTQFFDNLNNQIKTIKFYNKEMNKKYDNLFKEQLILKEKMDSLKTSIEKKNENQ